MKFSSAIIVAASAFFPLIDAHAQLCEPLPYAFNNDNAPLAADGSNFPCKMPKGTLESTYSSATGPVYTPGQQHQFKVKGSAVHGGGSCQVSITYDNPPRPDSVFKVVQSYEGSCPFFIEGNIEPANPNNELPAFNVMIPDGIPAGPATFVWSWFNKIGNREMYMDCAPVTIGGSGKSTDVYDSLPDMFVANIGVPQSKCTTVEKVDILFPNPGQNVIRSKDACNFQPACGGDAPPAAAPGGGNKGGDSGAYVPPTPPTPPAGPKNPPVPGNGEGGVFIPITTTVYNAPGAEFTPINGSPSTTMSTVVAKPTGSYGGGSGNGSDGPSDGEGDAKGGNAGGVPSGPSDGNGDSMDGGKGNDSAPAGTTCDGSWIVKCDAADPEHFTLCYGKNQLAQKMAVNPGMTCEDVAAAHQGSYKNKFRRHAREHLRRMVHRHSRH